VEDAVTPNHPDAPRPELSVVIPMYNEEENAPETLRLAAEALDRAGVDYELVPVDDGSADGTWSALQQAARANARVRPAGYRVNFGRGRALKTGFAQARGRIVCAIDADLSYSPDHILRMLETLRKRQEVDIVLASAYMPGGRTEGVPFWRLLLSRYGNHLLSAAMPGKIHTITCVVRAYRREVLERLDIESDGKEIHLEILAKALSLGYRITEIPAVLRARRKGKSKAKVKSTIASHLMFSFIERPILLFGFLGLFATAMAFLAGGYIVYLWQSGVLNPVRPLMTLMTLLFLGGLQLISFGLLAMLVGINRKELYRIERQNREILMRLDKPDEPR